MNPRQVTVENFGPIKKGTVSLKPLTIFIGPSNSGKSYMSTLIYSILNSENLRGFFRPGYSPHLRKSIKKELSAIMRNNKSDIIEIPPDALKNMYSLIIKEMFDNNLKQNLERSFFTSIENLTRKNTPHTKIKISTFADVIVDLNGNLEIKKITLPDTKYIFKISNYIKTFEVTKDKSSITITIGKKYKQTFLKHDTINSMIKIMCLDLWENSVLQLIPFYFPASRSGILKTYPETAASVIEDLSYSILRNIKKPVIDGIITDFIAPLIALQHKKTPFFKLAEEMESDVFRGKIDTRVDKQSIPQLFYTFDGNTISLDNASSAVSELAPLLIYLKYIVQEGGLLIIEEPESHLHPHAQALLAKHIIKMVQSGLKVLVTTHSTFLLAEFGKYVLADRLDEKRRKRLKVETHITADDVSPYVFRKNKDESYNIISIPFDDESGISQEEFGKVEHKLYDRWLKVVSNLPIK